MSPLLRRALDAQIVSAAKDRINSAKHRKVIELLREIEALKAKLDICKRYAEGEGADGDYCDMANDYGGTGYELDPACVAVAALQAKVKQANKA